MPARVFGHLRGQHDNLDFCQRQFRLSVRLFLNLLVNLFQEQEEQFFVSWFQGNIVSSQDGAGCFEWAHIGEREGGTLNKNITAYLCSLSFFQ